MGLLTQENVFLSFSFMKREFYFDVVGNLEPKKFKMQSGLLFVWMKTVYM